MISIIVCSVKPTELIKLSKNIEKTIGIPYEIIPYDNRRTGKGICEVYNLCATKAEYDYLGFAHEDILFDTENWGETIIAQLKTERCGAIGFAGATFKSEEFSSWGGGRFRRTNYREAKVRDGETLRYSYNPDNELFSQVVVLDGLCLFTPRKVWEKYPFDENRFQKFHLYDLDFTFQLAQEYKNYVCHNVEVTHYSSGSYSRVWYEETLKFHQKWRDKLPFYIHQTGRRLRRKNEVKSAIDFMNLLKKSETDDLSQEIKKIRHSLYQKYPYCHRIWKIWLKSFFF